MSEMDVYRKALELWGTDAQLDMVIEECAELIDAIQKWRRHRVESIKVVEELVDVSLMIEQLKLMLDAPTYFDKIRKDKLQRLKMLTQGTFSV